MKDKLNKQTTGAISIIVLVIGLTMSIAVGGLALLAATQYSSSTRTEVYEKALTIAQSGAEYYRWHLAHAPNDFTDGTGHAGPYIHTMADPYGNTEATYSLTITQPIPGSSIVTITSTGWLNSYPDIKRTVVAKYGIPSLAKFAFLNNSNIWFGQKIQVYGKVFANGGIRMDGTHDSLIQSAKQTYTCGTETGCSPSATKNGVWGEGGPSSLWQFPVPAVDFNSIALDFNQMKTAAQQNGVYKGASGGLGYHVIFAQDGSVTVKKVTAAANQKGWSVENNCENLSQKITAETTLNTYTLSQKQLYFFEDTVWVEGVVKGTATVVAARFPLNVNKMNIWLPNSITYAARDKTNSLGLIAQNDIIMGLEIPQIMNIDAALLAAQGHVIRHNYKQPGCNMSNNAVRQQLNIYGSLISNLKSYWSYGQGSAGFGNEPASGFSQREVIYDASLYYTPPPYFPTTGEYEFISWEER